MLLLCFFFLAKKVSIGDKSNVYAIGEHTFIEMFNMSSSSHHNSIIR